MAGRVADAQMDRFAARRARARTPPRPTDTSRRDCARAGADTGSSRRRADWCTAVCRRRCRWRRVHMDTPRDCSPLISPMADPRAPQAAFSRRLAPCCASSAARSGASPPAICGCSATRSTPSARRWARSPGGGGAAALGPRRLSRLRLRQSARAHLRAHPLARCGAAGREALIERRLTAALALRERLGSAAYYRWVFGESDLLPGLVLDRYGELVVGQIATAGMEALKEQIEAAVREGARARARCSGRTTPPRASSSSCRSSPRPPSATSPAEIEVRRSGADASARRSPAGRRPAGSTTRAPTVRASGVMSPPARACSMSAATSVPGRSTALRRAPPAPAASIPRRRRSSSRSAMPRRNGVALETLRGDAFDALKALRARRASASMW